MATTLVTTPRLYAQVLVATLSADVFMDMALQATGASTTPYPESALAALLVETAPDAMVVADDQAQGFHIGAPQRISASPPGTAAENLG